MPVWQGKSRGTPLGYGIFVAVIRKGGVIPAYILLRFVAIYYFLFSFGPSGHMLRYFRRLGFGRLRSLRMLYRNYCLLGQTIIDRIVILSGMPNRFSFDFDGEEELRKMVAGGRGGLLISGHIGNWEIAGHLLQRLNARIHVVMYDGEDRQIKEYLQSVTGEPLANMIIIRDSISHIYQISEALKRGDLVCMHADRFVEGNKTLAGQLLNDQARFPAGPFALAQSLHVPVSFVFAMKESNLHYHFFASRSYEVNQEDKEQQMRYLLNLYTDELERKIRQFPEQWYNYFDFWKAY